MFSAQDKRRLLAEADRAAGSGEIGALLRREGFYSSALTNWRRQREAGILDGLTPDRCGPKANEPNPLGAALAKAQRDNARLRLRLECAEAIIDLQKVPDLLGIPLPPIDSDSIS